MADDRLLELIVEWEERRQKGEVLSADQLCPDDPALREALRERLRKRERFQAFLQEPGPTVAEALPCRPAIPKVDGFEILDVIGWGGMGVVYKARQLGLDRLVALKMILSGPTASAQELNRFRAEAQAVARLHHPNIVQIYEVGAQDGRPFLTLEYVPGGSLAQSLTAAPVPPPKAAELVAQLARAVHHAHQHGIVHRDLKPANILLTDQGVPKVTDFGLAKQLHADRGYTQTGAILGSPSYMAPEQAEGRLDAVGPASDVYALGAILYEMLTGRPPFNGTTVLDTLDQVRTHDPVPPKTLQPGVPRDLETICLKCLEKRPEDRYASAEELARDLENFTTGEPIRARSLSIWGVVDRNLRRATFDPRFARWGTWMIALSPTPLLIHLAGYALFFGSPAFPFLITWTTLLYVTVTLGFLFRANRAVLRDVPPFQRRHFITMWSTHLVMMYLTWFVLWMGLPPEPPELLLLAYPLWFLSLGYSYFAFAAQAGWLYVVGSVFVLLPLLIVYLLPWAPLVVAVLAMLNLLIQGLGIRKMGARQ